MSTKANYFKIGLFVIVAATLLAIGIVVLGAGSFFRKKVLVETYLNESVQGLDVGSPVKFRGVPIGNVRHIGFVHNEYLDLPAMSPGIRYVLVRCAVYPDMLGLSGSSDIRPFIRNEVQKGLRARLSLQSITGTAYIEVDYVNVSANPPLAISWEPMYSYIPSVQSLTAQLGDMLVRTLSEWEKADLPGAVHDARHFMETAERAVANLDLGPLQEETAKLVQEVRETNRRISSLLEGPGFQTARDDAVAALAQTRRLVEESSGDVRQVLQDMRQGSAEFSRASAQLNSFLSGPPGGTPPLETLSRTLQNLDSTSSDLPATVANLNSTLRRLERLVAGQQDAIASIVQNLNQMSQNLRDVSEDAKLYPSRVLFGEPPKPLEPGK